jgi:hypothetical protein
MRLLQRCLVLLRSDSNHQIFVNNAAKHVATKQERKAAEHFPFGHVIPRCEHLADSLGSFSS